MSNQVGFEALSVSTTAVKVTNPATIPNTTRSALFVVTKAAVRYRGDGTSPTSSTGLPLWPGQVLPIIGEANIRNAEFIRQDAADATVYCLAYDQVDIVSAISNAGLYEDDVAFTVGSPVSVIGGIADDTSPDSVGEGDAGALAMTLDRRLYVTPMDRGSSEVKNLRIASDATSTTVKTAITPTSGKKIRLLSVAFTWPSAVTQLCEVYFGTGATIATTAANAVAFKRIDSDLSDLNFYESWPDGAGPVGADDQVLSIRNGVSDADVVVYIFHYREDD